MPPAASKATPLHAPAPAREHASSLPAPGFSSAPSAPVFDTPPITSQELILPSHGLAYKLPDGTPAVPDGRVHIKPMTGEEEAILNSQALNEIAKVSKILDACLILPKTGIRHKDLLLTDRLIALFMIRTISLGAEYKLQAKCPACRRQFDKIINLAAKESEGGVRVEEMPRKKLNVDGKIVGEYVYDPIEGIPCVLPVSKAELRLRLLTAADEDFISMELRKGAESRFLMRNAAAGVDPAFFLRNALCVKSAKLEDGRFKAFNHSNPADVIDIVDKLRALPIRDTQYIDKVYSRYEVGVGRSYSAQCPGCGADVEVPLQLTAEFFRASDTGDAD